MIGFAKSALRKTGAFDAAKTLYERVGGTVYRPETEWIERTFQGRTDVFFVQIGAHDGKTNDYIYPIARKLGWRGILVEPIPYLFERLVQNYRGSQGLIFENAALAEQMGQKWFYRLRQSDDPNLPEWYDQLASLNKDVVLSHRNAIPNIDDLIIQEEVKSITFDDLAQRYQITAIDLILIDTEGYDLNILKMIDFSRFRPQLVIYEHKHLSTDDKATAAHLLKSNGYVIHSAGENNAAVRRQ